MIATACLQCGTPSASAMAVFCRRCGLPYGQPPRATAELPSCPVCYKTVDDDGLIESLSHAGRRVHLQDHLHDHEQHPVGDDEWLESIRMGDRIQIEGWNARFDLVRRYLVTGLVSGGRARAFEHNALVTAMTQLGRWGPNKEILGDQVEWKAARTAVTRLMERYHRAH